MPPAPRPPVSMQVTLTPSDLDEVRHLLPHQLRVLGSQVDEVLCLVDLPPWKAGGQGLDRQMGELAEFFEEQRLAHPHLSWRTVDYSPAAMRQVADTFYGGRDVPVQDYRNRPIYTYLYLLVATRHDLVFHIDCDMMFGGGSRTWMSEAVEHLAQRPDVLACNPLPGPPRTDGRLLSQRYAPEPEPETPFTYRFPTLSYRVFILDRRALPQRLGPLRDEWPSLRSSLRGLMFQRRRPHALLEQVVAGAMMRRGVWRLDFLGRDPGMWSLHPRYRTPRFKRALPDLIRLVERGQVHPAQRGEYDLTEQMLRLAESGEEANVTAVTLGEPPGF